MRAFRLSQPFSHHVATGKQALKGEHRPLLSESRTVRASASIAFEAAVHGLNPGRKRWDYFVEIGGQSGSMHGIEVHEFDRTALLGKKTGTVELLRQLCPEAIPEIKSWNVIVKGTIPRKDLISRFSADTKIKIRRNLSTTEL